MPIKTQPGESILMYVSDIHVFFLSQIDVILGFRAATITWQFYISF